MAVSTRHFTPFPAVFTKRLQDRKERQWNDEERMTIVLWCHTPFVPFLFFRPYSFLLPSLPSRFPSPFQPISLILFLFHTQSQQSDFLPRWSSLLSSSQRTSRCCSREFHDMTLTSDSCASTLRAARCTPCRTSQILIVRSTEHDAKTCRRK